MAVVQTSDMDKRAEFQEGGGCGRCGRLPVCSVHMTIKQLMESTWEEGKRPIEADRLAEICQFYQVYSIEAELKNKDELVTK